MDDVTAMILAGGFGTRLRSVLQDRPKVLAEVAGRPFLFYLLERIEDAGIEDVVLCTGHLHEAVEAAVGNQYGRVRICYSRETEPLGTGGALRAAIERLRTNVVLAMNGDSWSDVDIDRLRQLHARYGAEASIALAVVADVSRYGGVDIDDKQIVRAFGEKDGRSGPGVVNAGVYMIERAKLADIPAGRSVSIERETFPSWIGAGLYAFSLATRFIDIGTPQSLAQAEMFIKVAGSSRTNSQAA